jgi:hypothetical protein
MKRSVDFRTERFLPRFELDASLGELSPPAAIGGGCGLCNGFGGDEDGCCETTRGVDGMIASPRSSAGGEKVIMQKE